MHKLYEKLFFVFVLLFLASAHLSAQDKLWPGDANNNGITNCVDLLYVGVGFDETGPQRANATTLWQEQDVDSLWTNDFADNTTNNAFGDCNGDGVINQNDLEMAIKANYLLTHNSSQIVNNADAYVAGSSSDPVLSIAPNVVSVDEGGEIKIDLNLGESSLPLDDFYGVAMVISYDRPFVSLSTPVQFSAEANAFTDPSNGVAVNTINTNTLSRQVEFAYVRTNKLNASSGYGTIGTFSFIIDDDVIAPLIVDTMNIRVDSVRIIDKNLNPIPVNFAAASFEVEVIQSSRSSNPTNCPEILDPVCGSDGVTYMNSCFAKAAGITNYSSGVCFGECIDPLDIDPVALEDCSNNYIPVCGCNDVTYLNSCVAENSGLTEYTLGACVLTSTCFDPTLVRSSSGTSVDIATGIISENCDTEYDPVCGCDGFTYENSCLAEASGISFYTQGPCNNVCVDADMMDPNASCVNVYEPVCGCNDVTYSNACFADAAGVVSYTNGACGTATSASNWCSEASPIECGDYLASETTIGAGNDIESYYWNASVQYLGADKVYVINKDQAGDLQIGLEIITPGINLDLFLLSGDCDNLTCIGASQSSNINTNNEGIVLENAPIGTYYIVVDGLLASEEGDFKLEVSCGNLDCNDAIQLSCGQAFNYNNIHGSDNVSAYGCGNVLNVENNGNEVVHTFTLTQTGQVDIYLTNLNQNLELFLLEDCDRGDCAQYSSNPGATDEHISTLLQPGTYYVVVDGYNGATSNYELLVDCPSSCNIDVDVTSSGTNCGQSNGSFTVNSTGGTPGYIVTWTGPISGSFTTYSNTCTIYNIPPGVYTVTKTDANGCNDSQIIEVEDLGSHLEANLLVKDAVCSTKGSVNVTLSNGQAPYQINISGPISGTATSTASNFNINQLPAGDYTIFMTDKVGCTVSNTFTVLQDNNNFTLTGYTTPSQCEALGKIHITLANGSPIYTIHVSGPVSGSATTYSSNFNIPNLPGGTYTVTIEDSNWCSDEMTFVIEEQDIDIDLVSVNGICGENGALTINISNGAPQYLISWDGPTSGSVTSSASTFTIPDLSGGAYSVTVMDANWCQAYQVATIDNTVGTLAVDVSIIDGTCGASSLWIDINDGTAPYTIGHSGPQNGIGTTSTNGFDISNLIAGTYTIEVSDANGCDYSEVITISPNNNTINVSAWPNDGNCGALGNIEVTVTNGSSPYTISYDGPSANTVTSTSPIFIIDDLVSGNYTIDVTDDNGCMDSGSAVIANTGSGMTISTAPWNGTCGTPGEITIDIVGGSPAYNVIWDGPSSGAAASATPNYTINNVLSGSYGITVTDSEGCSDTGIQIIDNNANDLTLDLIGTDGQCEHAGSISVSVSGADAPYTITYTGPINGSGTTADIFNISNATPGIYGVSVASADGCVQNEEIEILNVGNPLMVTSSTSASVCGGGGSINVMYDTDVATITWTGAASGTATGANGIYLIDNLLEGVYDVVVSDGNGCDVTVQAEIIEINNNFDFTVAPTNGVCQSNGSALITFGSGQYDIVWTGPSSGNASDNTGAFEIQDLPAGDYTIYLIDSNGCKTTKQFTIGLNNSSVTVTANGTNGICLTNGSIDVAFDLGAGMVSWTGPTSGSSFSDTGMYTILDLTAGTYVITVEATNGCTGTATVAISNTSEVVTLTATPVDAICNGNGSIVVTTDANTINYTGPIAGTGTPNNGSFHIGNAPVGTYAIIATNGNGCTAQITAEVMSSGSGTIMITATAQNDLCGTNGSVFINTTGGSPAYTVQVNGPVSSTQSSDFGVFTFNGLTSGTYTANVSDSNGCVSNTSFVIANSTNSNLNISATAVHGSCGQTPGFLLNISGGAAVYTVNWTGPENGTTTTNNNMVNVIDLTPGTYNVNVIDSNGCSAFTSITVTDNGGNFAATVDVTNAYCDVLGSIWVNVNTGTPPYNLTWSGVQTGTYSSSNVVNDISNLPAGTYSVTISDANGCSMTQTLSVLENGIPTQFTGTVTQPTNTNDGSVLVQIITNNPSHTVSWTGPSSGMVTLSGQFFNIDNLVEGTYSVVVKDKDGCSSTQTFVLTNSSTGTGTGSGGNAFALNANPTDMTCGNPGNIFLSMANGEAPYTIAWSGTSSGTDVTSNEIYDILNLQMGNYSVTITDAQNNQTIGSATISGSEAFEIITSTNNGSCGNDDGSISVEVTSGSPNYSIFWTGPTSNNATFNNDAISIDDLASGTYDITVSDANSCAQIFTTTVNNSAGGPEGNFVSSSTGLTSTFVNSSSSGLYSWDFGDGNTSTATNPTYEFCEAGTYTVCLTVTNTCGSNTTCNDVIVSLPTDVVILDVQNASGSTGSSLSIPVTIANCESLVSLAGSIEVANAAVCVVNGISPGVINPNYLTNNSTFNYVNNNVNGINITDGDILFYIDVTLTGAANESTTLHITNNPLQVEVGSMVAGLATALPSIQLKGEVSVASSARISGNVKTYWGEGIENTQITILSENIYNTQMTDTDGYFMEPDLPMGEMYSVTPERDFNDQNGLSSYALFVGQRFILGMDPIEIVSPYQVIAGDANCSNSFTTIDLFILQQLIIGTTEGLDFCPSWTFVKENDQMPTDFDSYNVFPYNNSDEVMVMSDEVSNFVGVKVGDILGHANPANLMDEELTKAEGVLDLYVNEVSVKKGETFELEFSSNNFNDIVSYQLGLAFDQEKMAFGEMIKSDHPELKSLALGASNAEQGKLRASWFSLNGTGLSIQTNDKLFTLRFTALEDIENILDYVSLNNKAINTEAHNEALEPLDVVLYVQDAALTSVSGDLNVGQFNLGQNTPNPFTDFTQIEFTIPRSMQAEVAITNVLGETVKVISQYFNEGANTIVLNQDEIGTGVFHYTLTAGEVSITKSLISIK